MIEDARLLLAAWRERLVTDAEVIAWADRMIEKLPVADLPSWLLDLSVEGPGRCTKRGASDFLEVPDLPFSDAFAIRAKRVNLEDAEELDAFVSWASRACMGEDLEKAEVRLSYQLDHLLDRDPAAATLAKTELPALRARDNVTASRLVQLIRPKFGRDFWEQLWSKTLREHANELAHRPPNAHLMAEAGNLPPGRALDAGCGHGADTLWLAAHGWQVTAIDFSAAALAHGRSMAEAGGADVAARIDWIESDLATWTAEPGRYDLVVCSYVHVAGSLEDFVERMANAVARGGTLFLVGHRPIDPSTGAATAAANQVQVSVEGAVAALDSNEWELVVAEERPRSVAGTGVDAVIRARRRTFEPTTTQP